MRIQQLFNLLIMILFARVWKWSISFSHLPGISYQHLTMNRWKLFLDGRGMSSNLRGGRYRHWDNEPKKIYLRDTFFFFASSVRYEKYRLLLSYGLSVTRYSTEEKLSKRILFSFFEEYRVKWEHLNRK